MAKRERTVLSPVKRAAQMVRCRSDSTAAPRNALTCVVCHPPQLFKRATR